MTAENKLLKRLKEQEASLKLKIREAQKVETKNIMEAYTKKCAIVGAAILAEIKDNETLKESIDPIIDKQTTIAKDRKILGLSPLSKSDKKKDNN